METTNCIVVHGCPVDKERAMDPQTRTYDKHWIPWIRRELTAKGIQTETPLMPEPWSPDYERFKRELENYPITRKTILIGTSCGCSFLVRWLGETKRNIFKLILVAPWKISDGDTAFRDFYVFPIDTTIQDRVKEIIMFTADNESREGKDGLKMFHSAIGGRVINLPGHGHYIMQHMGTEEFPELLQAVLQ
jgi:predicted alpha/beta hydrolase family esterase